jgi:AcrR family transcriptional regulator
MGLNRNQKRAIPALLQTSTVADAARVCGLSERTLWRYLNDEEFNEALRKRQDDVIRSTTAALVGLSSDANSVLRDLMMDKQVSASVRARVALGIKRLVHEAVELQDVVSRLEALENETSD